MHCNIYRVEHPLWHTEAFGIHPETGEIEHERGGIFGFEGAEVRFECECGGAFSTLSDALRHLQEEWESELAAGDATRK